MSVGLRRATTRLACRFLQDALSPRLQSFGRAVRHEVAEITDDADALLFALGSLCGLAPRFVAVHLLRPLLRWPARTFTHREVLSTWVSMMPRCVVLVR
jgi:hypothetical protein